ncbi:hypothetical protein PL321_02795 [Caloramator sp. mosi_1]|uniref:hypothetical protein n=1 Tax=Caloramator sp. mosi_1 TaxID=3023090 RepID=UPI002361E197|nr:hypothetical protein [Caloramator sp. mosi_1]WDC84647.1 hypothetical protein PL321_02795 [Caloramator sp. mosi_1]
MGKVQGNPVIVADERYYEKQQDAYNKHEGCRDPFVVYDEDEKMYYAFLQQGIKMDIQNIEGA